MAVNILLIDDDSDDRDIFYEALETLEYQPVFHTAPDGKEAFVLLPEIVLPDIIFLDINMPIMNGWECLKRLKEDERYRNIPVIMYSTSSYLEDVRKSEQLGALCFFSKPHDFEELKNSLNTVIEYLTEGKLEELSLHSRLFIKATE
jgi:CheY-like chemotaxis protein